MAFCQYRSAVTVHRVQGATLEGDVHVLLNSEFFAEGQAVSIRICTWSYMLCSWTTGGEQSDFAYALTFNLVTNPAVFQT